MKKLEMMVDTILLNNERAVVIDTQDRVLEWKQGEEREIRDIEERKEVLKGTEWEFLAELVL